MRAFRVTEAVHEYIEASFRDGPRVKELKRSCRRVAGIREKLFSRLFLIFVYLFETLMLHIYFTADFHEFREPYPLLRFQYKRDRPDRLQIVRNVITLYTISPGRTLDPSAAPVKKRNTYTVEFQLYDIFDPLPF